MRLHRFNDEGLQNFHQFLDALSAEPATAVPTNLLGHADCAVPVAPGIEVESRPFANRMEMATYLDERLSGVTGCDVQRDVGLWTWLTLFYFDQVCPTDRHGHRKPGERARYVPAFRDYRKFYRHLLAGPYRVFRAHRNDPAHALIVLCGPLHKPGDIAEQLLSRQEIITNAHAMAVATALYFNPETGSFRRGAATRGGKGAADRLPTVLNQLDLTWDLYGMSSTEIMGKLPKEFDRFRPSVP